MRSNIFLVLLGVAGTALVVLAVLGPSGGSQEAEIDHDAVAATQTDLLVALSARLDDLERPVIPEGQLKCLWGVFNSTEFGSVFYAPYFDAGEPPPEVKIRYLCGRGMGYFDFDAPPPGFALENPEALRWQRAGGVN